MCARAAQLPAGLLRMCCRASCMHCLLCMRAAQEEGAPLSLSHYQGVYQLHEPVTRGPARVNVSRFDPVGLSGAAAAAALPSHCCLMLRHLLARTRCDARACTTDRPPAAARRLHAGV